MALDPIPAVTRIAAARALLGAPREPAADQASTLRLVLGAGPAGELLGRGENGHVYRVAAAGDAAAFQPGQTLLVQVLRTGPPLEVRLLGSLPLGPDATGLPAGTEADLPALRPDQAAILRLAAAPSQAKAQAAHWRQLALTRVRQASTVQPGHSVVAAALDGAAEDGEAVLPLRVPPWHGWPLALWLAPRSRAYSGTNRRARRRHGTRLGLALSLPGWGTVGLLFDVLDQQVGLTVATTRTEAVPWLRDQVGAIAARLGKAGLRLMRCHVRHEPGFTAPTTQARPSTLAEHELPLVLFRAATETLEALRPERRSGTPFDAGP